MIRDDLRAFANARRAELYGPGMIFTTSPALTTLGDSRASVAAGDPAPDAISRGDDGAGTDLNAGQGPCSPVTVQTRDAHHVAAAPGSAPELGAALSFVCRSSSLGGEDPARTPSATTLGGARLHLPANAERRDPPS